MARKVFIGTIVGVLLFFIVTMFAAMFDIYDGYGWIKESFEWISIYGLPWVIVILLYLILMKMDRK